MNNLKSLPHSVEAEQALLGVLIAPYKKLEDIEGIINKKDMFYAMEHQAIFSAIWDLFIENKSVDVVIVASVLQKNNELEFVGGSDYLENLAQSVIPTANIENYAQIIKDNYILRQMLKVANNITSNVYNSLGKSIDQILEQSEQEFYAIRNDSTNSDLPEFEDILTEFVEDLHLKATGDTSSVVPTGISMLDAKLLGGFEKGDLVIVAGRPGMGKTTFVIQMLTNMLRAKRSVIMLSLETTNLQMTRKIASNLVNIPVKKFKTGELTPNDFEKVFDFIDTYKDSSFHFMPTKNPTLSNVKSYVRKISAKIIAKNLPEPECLVIDYLSLMNYDNKTNNLAQALGDITKGLKQLALEMKIPIVLICQLNRNVEHRADKRPQMADLKDSGAIEQDADKILLLYREDYYKTSKDEQNNITTIIIPKNREGNDKGNEEINLHYDSNSSTLESTWKNYDDFQFKKAGDK